MGCNHFLDAKAGAEREVFFYSFKDVILATLAWFLVSLAD